MTLFAGAFCLDARATLPTALQDSLTRHLRHPDAHAGGELNVQAAPGFFLAGWDSGAFAEPAWRESADGSLCVLTGDPLLVEDKQRLVRAKQLDRLAPAGQQLDDAALARCRGSFALLSYDCSGQALQLATDAVGLRSIYYALQDGILIFATALRILEAMPEVRKQLSILGMAELSAFSFPLAERTPYEDISILRESAVLEASSAGLLLRHYLDWAAETPEPSNIEAAAAQIDAEFQEAVRLRAANDRHVYSFLSGGMDSRAIVAALVKSGRTVEALNFSAEGSQDRRFAERMVANIPEHCTLHCLPGGSFPNFSFLALAAKTELEQRKAIDVDRPSCIWSGDGGSVGIGHVYMDERMLEIAEREGVEAAAAYFLELNRSTLPIGVLNKDSREQLPRRLLRSVVDEINRYPHKDLGRRIYLFLLFNDQRRHLFKHFETIDRHGLELLTPFYDAGLLKVVASMPARWGILHRLYASWFELLPEFARKTPWQTYPGHVPCPVVNDEVASYQWSDREQPSGDNLGERLKVAFELLQAFRRDMRPQVFSTGRIWLAALSHVLALRDCRHILKSLQAFRHHNALTTK